MIFHAVNVTAYYRILLWVDDFLFPAETIDDVFRDQRAFYTFCEEWYWLLNPRKRNLYRLGTQRSGGIISTKGIRHDPENLDGVAAMEYPITSGQLQQFLCAMQWIRLAIANFQALINDLHDFMERIYTYIEKQTKRVVSRISLTRI